MQNIHEDIFKEFEWILDENLSFSAKKEKKYSPPYGDVTELNNCRLILDSVGKETLEEIGDYAVSLLGTSLAIYETNGNNALELFSSGWCRVLDTASRELCNTTDNSKAASCGKWLCHECCWNDSAKKAIDTGKSTDIECVGGIHLYAEPIYAGEKIVGAINIGYGNPPKDSNRLQELSDLFKIDVKELEKTADHYKARPEFMIEMSKKLLGAFAKMIGDIVEKAEIQQKLEKDITERKIIKHKLQISEEKYHSIFDNSALGIFRSTPEGRYELVNKAFARILGFEHPNKMINDVDDISKLYKYPEDREKIKKEFAKKGFVEDYEVLANHAKKDIVWISINAKQKAYPDGSIYYDGTIQDISKRKLAEKNIQEKNEQFETIIKGANLGWWDWDIKSGNEIYNETLAENLGYEPSEVEPHIKWWESKIHPDDVEEVNYVLQEHFKGNTKFYENKHRLKTKSGQWKWFLDFGKIIERDSEGNAIRMIGTLRDIDYEERSKEKINTNLQQIKIINANTPNIIWKSDIDKHFNFENTYISDAADEFLALPNGTIDNSMDKFFSYILPEYLPLIKNVLKEAIDNPNKMISVDYEVKKADGEIAWLTSKGRVINENKKSTIYGSTIDITQRKQTKEALQKSQTILENAEEISDVGSFEFDIPTKEITFSEGWLRIHGCTNRILTLRELLPISYPDDIPMVKTAFDNAIKNIKPYNIEHRIIRQNDGEVRITKAKGKTVCDEHGKPIKLYGAVQDITEQKLADAKIKEDEERFSYAMNASNDGIFDWNLETNEIYYSPGWKTMLGYEDWELPNDFSVWETTTKPEDVKKSWELQQKLISKQIDRFVIEFQMKHKDGHWIDVLARAQAIFNENGKAIRIVGTHTDITESKEAEKKLIQSKERFSKLIENMPSGVAIYKPVKNGTDFEFIDTNKKAEIITRSSKESLIGHTLLEKFPNMKNSPLIKSLRKIYKDGNDIYIPPFYYKDEQREGWRENHIYKLHTGEIVAIFNDITELKESEEKFRAIYENAPFLINSFDENGKCILWNKECEKVLGYTMEEINEHDDPFSLFYPDDKIRAEVIKAIVKNDQKFREWNPITKNGKTLTMLWSNSSISGNLSISIGQDITERKQAEKDIIALRKRNQALVDHSPVSHKIVDLDFNLQYMSANGFKMLKLEQNDELYGKPYPFEFFNASFQKEMLETMEKVKKTGNTLTFEGLTNDIEGKKIWLESTLVPVMNEGEIDYLTIVSADTTQRKRDESNRKKLEQQLIQNQKSEAIGNLAGGIAHDFNNILTPIVGMSELLLESMDKNSLEYENASEILIAGIRGSELVKQILTFSRQSEHKMMPIYIQKIIKEVLKLSRSAIPSYIDIVQDIQSDCGLAMADSIQIHQVAMNLITNAYHAVEEADSNKITIRLREEHLEGTDQLKPGKYAVLSVSDNGLGISDENLDKIFDPYFTTKKLGKGTGLGLSVVYGIILEHKGDIKIKTELGKGTTFNVYLPLMDKKIESDNKPTIEKLQSGNERILVVDDEPSIVKLVTRMLEPLGYSITSFTNSTEALKTFKESPESFDIIISDMNMPNISGDRLASEVRSISNIPFIICTGFSEKLDNEKAHNSGISEILMKPVTRVELTKKVRKLLDRTKKEK